MRTILLSLTLMFTACVDQEPTQYQTEPGVIDPQFATPTDLKANDFDREPVAAPERANPIPPEPADRIDSLHAQDQPGIDREPQRCDSLNDCGPAEFCQLELHICVVEPK